MSSGEGIWGDMVLAWDVLHLEPVHHGLQLDIHEPWVGDVFQVLLVAKYC